MKEIILSVVAVILSVVFLEKDKSFLEKGKTLIYSFSISICIVIENLLFGFDPFYSSLMVFINQINVLIMFLLIPILLLDKTEINTVSVLSVLLLLLAGTSSVELAWSVSLYLGDILF